MEDKQAAGNGASPHLEDLRLARDALAGSREALLRFAERARCVPRILAAQNARIGAPLADADLEDLAQETVVAVWRRLGDYRGEAALTTWMYRFCHFGLRNWLRRQERASAGREATAGAVDPQEPASVRFEHLYRALDVVGVANATVVRMKHFDALSFEEIGVRLSQPPSTVKSNYYRTLSRLREILARDEPELAL